MPHFFLHIRDGDRWIEDREGIDFAELDAAKAEATSAARELLAERMKAGQAIDGQKFEICDASGRKHAEVFFRDAFRFSEPV